MGWATGLLALPLVLGLLALRTGRLAFKVAVPGACAAILLLAGVGSGAALWVVAALTWSMVGDAFLSTKGSDERRFVLGIGAYLLAHVGYGAYALSQGGIHWLSLALLLIPYLSFYLLKLRPAIDGPALALAVLCYLCVSCAVLAAALGMRTKPAAWGLYVLGIALVLFSDTAIALNEFLAYRALNGLILPTYYAAHLCVTSSVLLAAARGSR